jgi:O-acetylserine/cysteine efflux transporter
VLAVAFGVLLWGDTLTWKLVLGGALTLAGIVAISLPARRAGTGAPGA